MINNKKANMEVLKGLYDSLRVCGHYLNDYFVVTVNGYYAWIISKDQILFDVSKVKLLEKPIINNLNDFFKEENRIDPTDEFRLISGNLFARKFQGNGHVVWINNDFLKKLGSNIRSFEFYQDMSKKEEGKDMSLMPIMAARRYTDYEDDKKIVTYSPEIYMLPIRVFDV